MHCGVHLALERTSRFTTEAFCEINPYSWQALMIREKNRSISLFRDKEAERLVREASIFVTPSLKDPHKAILAASDCGLFGGQRLLRGMRAVSRSRYQMLRRICRAI